MSTNLEMFATARESDELLTVVEYFNHRADVLRLPRNIASSESGRVEEQSELLLSAIKSAEQIADAENIAKAIGARNVALPEFAVVPNHPLYFKVVDAKQQLISLTKGDEKGDLVLIKFQYKNLAGISKRLFAERIQYLDGPSHLLARALDRFPAKLVDKCDRATVMSVPSLRTAEVEFWAALSTVNLGHLASGAATVMNDQRVAILIRAGHLWFEIGAHAWVFGGWHKDTPAYRYVP